VTHHIEEIMPVFTHTLLLQKGKVFDKGESQDILTSKCLSRFFDVPVQIEWLKNRAWMTIRK